MLGQMQHAGTKTQKEFEISRLHEAIFYLENAKQLWSKHDL